MNSLLSHRYILRQNIMMVLGACLCFYFIYHSIHGSRSFPRLLTLEGRVEAAKTELRDLRSEREELESRVVMLRPSSLNKDFLEERARIVLGYKTPEEMIILK